MGQQTSLATNRENASRGAASKRCATSLLENESVLRALQGIVCSLTSDAALRQDLMQEALVHAWQVHDQRPGQTFSWYLQSCGFRLRHYLDTGRSVDSMKRSRAQVCFPDEGRSDDWLVVADAFSQAHARDMVSAIGAHLSPKEGAVLSCLAEGLSTAEMARRLKLSAPTVQKYRRKIASCAIRLGLAEHRQLSC